jgi:RNA polymerase sigma-70 factor (ECF subfamily)
MLLTGNSMATDRPCVTAAWLAYEAELRGYLRHRLADQADADDLLQEVFVKVLRQGPAFCSLHNPRAWLFQVARNLLVDRLRARRVLETLPDDLPDPAPLLREAIDPVDALAGCLQRSLHELPVRDGAILQACDLVGQTLADFAQAQGLSLPAAKSRLLRARQRLRQHLVQVCQVQFDADGRVGGHLQRPQVPPPEPAAPQGRTHPM